MTVDGQILFFLSAIGAFNGLLLSVYFFILKPRTLSNKFLAGLLLMLSVRILKSVIYFFDPDLPKIYLQIGLSACFLIGPFLYLFCLDKTGRLKTQLISWKVHLSILFIIVTVVGIIFPYQKNPDIWGSFIFNFVNYSWGIYILLSGIVFLPYIRKAWLTKQKKTNDDILILSIYFGNVLIWFAFFTSSYTSYIMGALSFSFVFYLTFLLLVFKMKSSAELKAQRYNDKKIAAVEADQLIKNLQRIIDDEKLYRNADITLPEVAKKLGVSVPRLSQLLNDNLSKSFSIFIGEYRIEEAKGKLMNTAPIKMEVIAEQCGFNSQSTFYATFKKITGITPALFRERNT